MSIDICHDCERYVDTDKEPSYSIEVGNMRRQTKMIFLCEPCLEKREEEQDYADWQAARMEYEAELAEAHERDERNAED